MSIPLFIPEWQEVELRNQKMSANSLTKQKLWEQCGKPNYLNNNATEYNNCGQVLWMQNLHSNPTVMWIKYISEVGYVKAVSQTVLPEQCLILNALDWCCTRDKLSRNVSKATKRLSYASQDTVRERVHWFTVTLMNWWTKWMDEEGSCKNKLPLTSKYLVIYEWINTLLKWKVWHVERRAERDYKDFS